MADQATEHISVAAPPEQCFVVAADLERYPEWAADIKEVEIKERDDLGRPLLVTFRAAAFGRSTSYTLPTTTRRRPTSWPGSSPRATSPPSWTGATSSTRARAEAPT